MHSKSALLVLIGLTVAQAQDPAQKQKIAALKQSLAGNQKLLRQYEWLETTVVNLKGEDKSRTQKRCFYGPDGKTQKQPLSAPAPQQSKGGLKGKVIEKKKEEMTEYMQQAVALIHRYVPPDSQQIQAAAAGGKLSVKPGGGAVLLEFRDYLKPGDSLSLNLDNAANSIQAVNVSSYLESPKDAITLSVNFARLNDGVSYPANIVLNAPEKNIRVTVQNSNYQRTASAAAAPARSAPAAAPVAGATGIDELTGPIALYPDALVAQILDASTNFADLEVFAGWLKQNSNLKGSGLQEEAQKAGFPPALLALSVFPDVIQMMVQKPEWTKALGQAVVADAEAVNDSIQRLRKQAQSRGNLKTTEQQQVIEQKSSSGEQVIVIQPANPQVVYVPQYNPQVVYVQSAPPPPPSGAPAGAALIGFTAGVIVGAAANNTYYAGPYAWHRPPVPVPYHYNYAAAASLQQQRYNNAASLQQQRYNNAAALQDDRQQYASQRQSQYQQNAAQRQGAADSNQSQRQSAAQANQAQRQSAASNMQAQSGANQAQRQSAWQSQASTSGAENARAASQRSGMSSGGFSGYQGGGAARAESARGSRSLSESRSGGRRR